MKELYVYIGASDDLKKETHTAQNVLKQLAIDEEIKLFIQCAQRKKHDIRPDDQTIRIDVFIGIYGGKFDDNMLSDYWKAVKADAYMILLENRKIIKTAEIHKFLSLIRNGQDIEYYYNEKDFAKIITRNFTKAWNSKYKRLVQYHNLLQSRSPDCLKIIQSLRDKPIFLNHLITDNSTFGSILEYLRSKRSLKEILNFIDDISFAYDKKNIEIIKRNFDKHLISDLLNSDEGQLLDLGNTVHSLPWRVKGEAEYWVEAIMGLERKQENSIEALS